MPDKQNENKLMAMLERRGIVRKADSENEQTDKVADDVQVRPDLDLKTVMTTPQGEVPIVTPAARQPVPGLSNPVFPGDRAQNPDRDQKRAETRQQVESRVVDISRFSATPSAQPDTTMQSPQEQPQPVTFGQPEQPKPDEQKQEEKSKADEPIRFEQPKPEESIGTEQDKPIISSMEEQQKPPVAVQIGSPLPPMPAIEVPVAQDRPATPYQSFQPAAVNTPMPSPQPQSGAYVQPYGYNMDDTATDGITRMDYPDITDNYDVSEYNEQALVPDYTDRYLEIDDLYEVLSLRSKRTDTIYLIEEYLKSLPESLPDESRREIVSRIVAASGFDYDLLMGDGVLRVKTLKEYAEKFARHTDDYVAARQSELDDLDQQILRIRRLIDNRRELHKRQFFTIEAEAQRLKDILTFISG